jgi:transposase-like protein
VKLDDHLQRLSVEFQPSTPTEMFLVRELARHAAMLEIAEQAEGAALRIGATTAANLAANAFDSESSDYLLAGAVTTEAMDRVTRYRRPHEKGWYQAYRQLVERRVISRGPIPPVPAPLPPFLFTETRCNAYLQERLQAIAWRCPRCHHDGGYWLSDRSRWQCKKCARQIGLRSGTIMERSPLALAAWFTVIWAIMTDRAVSIEDLMASSKIARRATVKSMRERICSALATPDASKLIAGLDRLHPKYATP